MTKPKLSDQTAEDKSHDDHFVFSISIYGRGIFGSQTPEKAPDGK